MKIRQFDPKHDQLWAVIRCMRPGDWFQIDETSERFELVVQQSMFKGSTTISILTFKCNGKYYMCNVWNHTDVYYLQEME